MDYKYNYSIIIPHHNLPGLLRRCVDSIPRRDDVQIIIVDDNSDPGVVDFENFPFAGEKNVEIIFDKSGKRQGHARNIGIDRAEGKWLMFADSDDFFFPSINRALDECVDAEADITCFKATVLDSETYLPTGREPLPNCSLNRYLRGDRDGEHYVRYLYPAPWGKIIRSSLVREHGIRFAEIERLEDAQFSYQCGHFARAIDVKDYAVYCYAYRPNTVTSNIVASSGYTLVKVNTDAMMFLSKNGLGGSPVYNFLSNDLFNNLARMSKIHNGYYEKAIDYMTQSGFSTDFIMKNLKHQSIINFKTRIAGILRR